MMRLLRSWRRGHLHATRFGTLYGSYYMGASSLPGKETSRVLEPEKRISSGCLKHDTKGFRNSKMALKEHRHFLHTSRMVSTQVIIPSKIPFHHRLAFCLHYETVIFTTNFTTYYFELLKLNEPRFCTSVYIRT